MSLSHCSGAVLLAKELDGVSSSTNRDRSPITLKVINIALVPPGVDVAVIKRSRGVGGTVIEERPVVAPDLSLKASSQLGVGVLLTRLGRPVEEWMSFL